MSYISFFTFDLYSNISLSYIPCKFIQKLAGIPKTYSRLFANDGDITIARIYDEVCAFEKERTKLMQEDIESMFRNSMETFADVEGEDRQALQFFSFICSLSLDVYVKKLLIEKLIDEIPVPDDKESKEHKEKEHKEKKK